MHRLSLLTSLFLLLSCSAPQTPHVPPPGFPVQNTPIPGAKMCGGMMGAQCKAPDTYCQYSRQASCGAADASGVCTPKPQMCTQEYAPVCGCGDITYPNACTAAANGVSVAYEGQCRR